MAHKESVQNEDLKEQLKGRNFFWNVSSSVGYTCANKPADVLLVQFFLNRWIADYKEHLPEWKPLVMDGKFGGKTWRMIKNYQGWRGWPVNDGAVGTTNGTRFYTPKQGKVYTILLMNCDYNSDHPQWFDDIRMDPMVPVELTNILSGPMPDLG